MYGTLSQDKESGVEHVMVEDDEKIIDIVGNCTASKLTWSFDQRLPFPGSSSDRRGLIGELTKS